MATLGWNLFEATYLRAELADIYGDTFDEDVLQKTTYAVIANLRTKGLTDIGPLPTTSITSPAKKQIVYVTPVTVTVGNQFLVNIGNTTIKFTATVASIQNVVTGLTNLINTSTSADIVDKVTAIDLSTRMNLESDIAGEEFFYQTGVEKNTGTSNPRLDSVTFQEAAKAQEKVGYLSTLTANFDDAWTIIAAGVKYLLAYDAVVRIQTTSGMDIARDRNLVQAFKANYDIQTLAYITVHNISNNASTFWKTRLESEISSAQSQSSSGQLTAAERIQILNADATNSLTRITKEADEQIRVDDNKFDANAAAAERQLEAQGIQIRLNEQERRETRLRLQEQERRYLVEDRENRQEKDASNGVWTAKGQFSITYLHKYPQESGMLNTIKRDLLNLGIDFFGLGNGVISTGEIISGVPIEVANYNLFNVTITADQNITYRYMYSDDGTNYQQFGADFTDTQINKSYYLIPTKKIKLQLLGLAPNTKFYVKGELKAQ